MRNMSEEVTAFYGHANVNTRRDWQILYNVASAITATRLRDQLKFLETKLVCLLRQNAFPGGFCF